MNENISKNKHMTADQRNEIFTMLENGDSVSKIASAISKDKSTISKEIRKHRIEQRISNALSKNGTCAQVKSCTRTHLCSHVKCNLKLCKKCDICQSVCPDFELYICKRLIRAPYVCNGCDSRKYCRKPIKYFYNPSHAHKEYKEVIVSSRTGINVTEDEQIPLSVLLSEISLSFSIIYSLHMLMKSASLKVLFITTLMLASLNVPTFVNVNIKFTKSVSLTFTSSGCYDLHLQSWTSYPLFDMTFL